MKFTVPLLFNSKQVDGQEYQVLILKSNTREVKLEPLGLPCKMQLVLTYAYNYAKYSILFAI